MTIKKQKTKDPEQVFLEKDMCGSTKYRIRREEFKHKYSRSKNKKITLEETTDYDERRN